MSSGLSENSWSNSGCRFWLEKPKDPFGVCVGGLASLRFSINLAAQFADSPSQDPIRQQELRTRLVELRRQYSEKIDEIILILRVHKTIDAKEEVERKMATSLGTGLPFIANLESMDPCI